RLKIMLLGVVGGLAGSFGLLFLLDQLDGSVKDVEFVKGLGAPLLAVIPRMQDPVLEARRKKRSVRLFVAASLYLLVMLCFPAMELLGLTYMDKVLDGVSALEIGQSAKRLFH